MSKITETKLQIACNQIPGCLEVTQMLQQYILINGLSDVTFSSYSCKLVDLALYFNKLSEYITATT